MDDSCSGDLPRSTGALEAQARALLDLAWRYEHERPDMQHSWLSRLWHGQPTLDGARCALIDRLQEFVASGGDPDLRIPVHRIGRPARWVPIVDFFLDDIEGLEIADVAMRLGAPATDTTLRKLASLALQSPGRTPALLETIVERLAGLGGLDWQQPIRGEHGEAGLPVQAILARACPRLAKRLAGDQGRAAAAFPVHDGEGLQVAQAGQAGQWIPVHGLE